MFLLVFLSPTFFACKLAPSGGRASRGRGPRRRRSAQHRAARGGEGAPGGSLPAGLRPQASAPPPHLYFNLNLNSLLFLLPLPAPPLSRSSADEIGPQARRPGSEGTADLAVSGAGPLLTEVRGRQRPTPHPQVVPEVSGHREGAGFEDGGRGPGKKAVG